MEQFNELMQKFVNLDYQSPVAIAQNSIVKILPVCKQIDPDNNGMAMLTAIVLSSLSADGVLTAKEQQFLCDTLNLNKETIEKLVSLYTSAETDLVDKFVDTITDVKADVITIVCAFAACDETIKREECAFIYRLLQ